MKLRPVRTLALFVILALIVVALRFTVFRSDPVPVTVFHAALGRVEETVTNSKAGTVKTRRRALLSPEIGGRVEELPVREGDAVRKGQVLLRLADAEYRAQVLLKERSLAAARSARSEACLAAGQAVREHARYLRLTPDQIVSEELLEQLESTRNIRAAACDAAGARVSEAEAALELARIHLSKTVLRAPFDAVVAEVAAEVGEWVTPSPPALPVPAVIELIQPRQIYVSAPLDEVDVAKVRVGQSVRITMDAFPGRSFSGRVVRVAPYVLDLEEHSRTFEIEVEFEDPDFARTLLPGTSADVEVILEAREEVLRVPSYALMEGNRVLVVEDSRLIAREVKTGLKNWAFTEIPEGLEAGEPVVVSLDRSEVREGAWARITGEAFK